jgi:peptidoglycan/LPS O-acetylase OafA/YrhL
VSAVATSPLTAQAGPHEGSPRQLRPPRNNLYIPSLDGIRAAAVLLVFGAHAGLNDRVPGSFGVTAFFFLSGYLITTLLRLEFDEYGKIRFGAFYLRRALRIFPPMYLVLAVASAFTALGLLEGFLAPDALLAQAFHLSNYYIVAHGWWDGRAPGTWIYWSLAVEEHFYLFFPLAYLAIRRVVPSRLQQFVVILTACAAVLAWRVLLTFVIGGGHDRTYVATDTRIDSILFGCALAVYGNPALDPSRISARVWKLVLFPLGLATLVVSFLIGDHMFDETLRYTIQGIALLPVFATAIRFHNWGPFRLLGLSSVRFIGVLSYSIYLMHPTILFAVHQWTTWHPVLQGGVALVVTLLLAWTMHRFVEVPCAQIRKRLSRPATVNPSATFGTVAWPRLNPNTTAE